MNNRNRKKFNYSAETCPQVTIQLPIYNEKYVATRLINAICRMDFPKERMDIQVLDDSDDETTSIIEALVEKYKKEGFNISAFRRVNRTGYKAGALKEGLRFAKGEFIAIFDADFIPSSDFLRKALSYFDDSKIGLVQGRWGHINEKYSILTKAQAVSLDFHFFIEQKAKSLTHLFMNFNGTAGIWRTLCIKDAGGWHTSTLVEDLDLSFRAQMKGWKCIFDEDLVVNAELPVQMNAAKRQQFRWAKGSVQVAKKLLIMLLSHRKLSIDTKIQIFIQLTKHIINPLFLLQFLIFPILLLLNYQIYDTAWAPALGIVAYLLLGPATYLIMIRKIWGENWRTKALQYLFMIFYAGGISINNSVAIFDALVGKRNEFLRTPKFGIMEKNQDWHNNKYALPFTKTTLLEIFFSAYGCFTIAICLLSGNPIFVPLMSIQTIGFIYVAYLSIIQSRNINDKTSLYLGPSTEYNLQDVRANDPLT
ncbi:MAG TPA: cellulose synthase family protein [Nitrososphaeraceae archaeon]|nr:cellulose synthase family protein [Nitrososphaeraceae archaeon]